MKKKGTKLLGKGSYSEGECSFRKEAMKITAIYLLFGFLWILLSDEFVRVFIADQKVLFRINVFKGLFYVLVTGSLIYFFDSQISPKNPTTGNPVDGCSEFDTGSYFL